MQRSLLNGRTAFRTSQRFLQTRWNSSDAPNASANDAPAPRVRRSIPLVSELGGIAINNVGQTRPRQSLSARLAQNRASGRAPSDQVAAANADADSATPSQSISQAPLLSVPGIERRREHPQDRSARKPAERQNRRPRAQMGRPDDGMLELIEAAAEGRPEQQREQRRPKQQASSGQQPRHRPQGADARARKGQGQRQADGRRNRYDPSKNTGESAQAKKRRARAAAKETKYSLVPQMEEQGPKRDLLETLPQSVSFGRPTPSVLFGKSTSSAPVSGAIARSSSGFYLSPRVARIRAAGDYSSHASDKALSVRVDNMTAADHAKFTMIRLRGTSFYAKKRALDAIQKLAGQGPRAAKRVQA